MAGDSDGQDLLEWECQPECFSFIQSCAYPYLWEAQASVKLGVLPPEGW